MQGLARRESVVSLLLGALYIGVLSISPVQAHVVEGPSCPDGQVPSGSPDTGWICVPASDPGSGGGEGTGPATGPVVNGGCVPR